MTLPAFPEGTAFALSDTGDPGDELTRNVRVRRPVAVVVSRFPKLTETFILREIEELERQGQPVRLVPLFEHRDPVVHPRAQEWVDRALYTGFLSLPILRANLAAFREAPGRYVRALARTLGGSATGLRALAGAVGLFPKAVYLGRRLASEGVGHIHAHFATHPALVASVASAFGGMPFSFTVHAHDIFLRASRPGLGWKIGKAAFVRAISDYNRRFLEARYPAAAGRTHVIHMGLDPDAYQRGAVRPGRIVCVAGLRPYKGIDTLLEACRRPALQSRAVEVLLVGDGPLRNTLEQFVDRCGLTDRVRFLGPRTEEEVRRLLASAHVFVHPSCVTRSGWMDGIPVALMEAMATGVPSVGTWVSGIPELIRDGQSGRLVFPSNPDQLAEALAEILDDAPRAAALGEAGRQVVQDRFHLTRCASDLLGLMDQHALESPPVAREAGEILNEAGIAGTHMGLARVHVRADSTVLEMHVTGGETSPTDRLVVKVHREIAGAERSARERARTEYETLRLLERAANGRVPAPQARALAEHRGALVMERVDGLPLDERIRSWRRLGRAALEDRLLPAARSAGVWLRSFQRETRSPVEGESETLVARLREGAGASLAFADPVLPGDLVRRTRDVLEAVDPVVVGRLYPPVERHCDFWPGNVLESRGRVTVIDFEGVRPGVAYQDLARFALHLDLLLLRPGSRGSAGRALAAFFEGYGDDGAMDPVLWKLCLVAEALDLTAREARQGCLPRQPLGGRRIRLARRWLEGALGPEGGA